LARQHRELIAREGWVFFFPPLILTVILYLLRVPFYWTVLCGVLAAYVAYFFRNPYRQIPTDENTVISPADGKVVAVRQLDDGRHLISIFLNIFNVHINRCPIAGRVETVNHTKGKFLAAYKPEASQVNERNLVAIRDNDFLVEVTQIAGLIARRIVCWSKPEDQVSRGQRFGLIRFGSRVDVVLPATCSIAVHEGQKISGGSDILAHRN